MEGLAARLFPRPAVPSPWVSATYVRESCTQVHCHAHLLSASMHVVYLRDLNPYKYRTVRHVKEFLQKSDLRLHLSLTLLWCSSRSYLLILLPLFNALEILNVIVFVSRCNTVAGLSHCGTSIACTGSPSAQQV